MVRWLGGWERAAFCMVDASNRGVATSTLLGGIGQKLLR